MSRRIAVLVLCVVLLAGAAVVAITRAGEDGEAAAREVVVWAVGDGGNGAPEAKEVAALIGEDDPHRILYLGDVYQEGTAAEFRDNFAAVYGPLARKMEPTPGNHEWGRRAEGYDPYWRSVKGRRVPYHYALDLGGWRVISLNSETPAEPAQLAFLRREMSRLEGNCVLVFMHRPRFTAGKHRAEEGFTEPLWRAMLGRVPLLIGGHDHNFQRLHPIYGTVQYVIGAGGRERHAVDEGDDRLAWSDEQRYGAMRMRLGAGIARLSIVAADGDVLDRSTVRCRRGS